MCSYIRFFIPEFRVFCYWRNLFVKGLFVIDSGVIMVVVSN